MRGSVWGKGEPLWKDREQGCVREQLYGRREGILPASRQMWLGLRARFEAEPVEARQLVVGAWGLLMGCQAERSSGHGQEKNGEAIQNQRMEIKG